MTDKPVKSCEETVEETGQRLDIWLTERMKDLSRTRCQKLIDDGSVTVNGKPSIRRYRVIAGDVIRYHIPEPEMTELIPENIPLDILYEDSDLIIINKAPGMVVHPAAGNYSGTLVNALLAHCSDLAGIGGEMRPGIVHRLDKDTSGVILVAKNDAAMNSLSSQFKERTIHKEYRAIVRGLPLPRTGTIQSLIGRSQQNRKKMSTRVQHGKEAVTHYRVKEGFEQASYMAVRIETGRTHQIRVHMAERGYPVLGDSLYGRCAQLKGAERIARQMLHARRIELAHPRTGEPMMIEAPLWPDMQRMLDFLRGSSPKPKK